MKDQESLKDCYEGCKWGCLFSWDRLCGDCRMPGSKDCAIDERKQEYKKDVKK